MELLSVVLIGAATGVVVGPFVGGPTRRQGAVVGALLGVLGATLGTFFGRAAGLAAGQSASVDGICAMLGASVVVVGYAVFRSRRYAE